MNDIPSRVEQACIDLADNHQPVTFTAVADAAHVSRATLYRNSTLRALVEHHRQASTPTSPLDRLDEDVATLRIAIEGLAQRVRRHDEQIRRLNRLTTKPPTD
ncbi:hypothetical protein CKJ59_20395 [Mycobacterium avium]|jgi:hypothetical protein|uniref:hypothetical protein n=1 Tax=Mycobacterium avium TaxID=1764 RepID=UPI00094A4C6C|nr:hypothetical protein [Mycobacterium avium]APT08986.1 hypothetical protein BS641_00425 [Mycobacterium avium subsp. hominissuis]APT09592.1 hypothetical protein BS641_04270 [Mycobacterium avium subsp. hominissuis]APT10387.1 hypothetical protein BS641_09040 [Mycobacterium avium subsp. hominissuis]APT11340.1 hypothetical protein BS641_14655 [Mycobacterium avium subsp. hominissuis]PBA49738.1 hypothetical protein CKJ59_20395 [Mycobacterium avium]